MLNRFNLKQCEVPASVRCKSVHVGILVASVLLCIPLAHCLRPQNTALLNCYEQMSPPCKLHHSHFHATTSCTRVIFQPVKTVDCCGQGPLDHCQLSQSAAPQGSYLTATQPLHKQSAALLDHREQMSHHCNLDRLSSQLKLQCCCSRHQNPSSCTRVSFQPNQGPFPAITIPQKAAKPRQSNVPLCCRFKGLLGCCGVDWCAHALHVHVPCLKSCICITLGCCRLKLLQRCSRVSLQQFSIGLIRSLHSAVSA